MWAPTSYERKIISEENVMYAQSRKSRGWDKYFDPLNNQRMRRGMCRFGTTYHVWQN